jgi:hypothetical protein
VKYRPIKLNRHIFIFFAAVFFCLIPGIVISAQAAVAHFQNGSMSPYEGSPSTNFHYYTQLVIDAPQPLNIDAVQVRIDWGTPQQIYKTMSQVDRSDLQWWYADTALPSGDHNYCFHAILIDTTTSPHTKYEVSSPTFTGPTVTTTTTTTMTTTSTTISTTTATISTTDVQLVNRAFAFNEPKKKTFLLPVLQKQEVISEEAAMELSQTKVGTTAVGDMDIAFFSEMIFPGRKFHFKIIAMGPKVAKVSIALNEKMVSLYSQDLVTWKGDTVLASNVRPGRYHLIIYVADIDGHLYTEKIEISVEATPEIKVIKASFQPNSLNTFEAKVSPQVARATLVMGNKYIPLVIANGVASAKFNIERLPQNSFLYLADRYGHVFTCSLGSDVGGLQGATRANNGGLNWPLLILGCFVVGGGLAFWSWRRRNRKPRWLR